MRRKPGRNQKRGDPAPADSETKIPEAYARRRRRGWCGVRERGPTALRHGLDGPREEKTKKNHLAIHPPERGATIEKEEH